MTGDSHPVPGRAPVIDTEPTNTPDQFSFRNATFEQVLEELSSRFILNLPADELAEVERVCFQVEQAHWYYEDFIREEKPSFPSLPLKKFSEILFHSCPLLHHWSHDHETAFNGFMSYKTRVPVCGAIMLNESLTKCVLVKGWKSSAGWGFPKGKVNENEDEAFCAVREVLEETGYNLNGQIRKSDCIRLCIKQQPITLFVVPGVPEDFPFKTQTRKEISKIDWFKLADLPTWKKNAVITHKFYLIMPVIGPLKAIVRTLRKARRAMSVQHRTLEVAEDVPFTEKDDLSPTEDQATSVAAESPLSMEPSSRSQSGEAEVSSSQSSSIDPHTPSINGDLAPHTCDNGIIAKHDFSTHIEQFTHDRERRAPLESIPPSVNVDPLSHWSRLMTRLNHSEESSPLGTPQTVTPTPPVGPAPAERESLHGSPPHGESMGGRPVVRPLHQEYSDVSIPQRTLKKHSNVGARPSSISSSFHPQGLPGRSTAEISIGSAATSPTLQTSTSTDVLTKRTRQLQLLDGVLAEELIKRTPPTPMSAHVLGAFPNTSGGPLLDHVRTLVRPASVDTDAIHTLSTPLHHQPLFPIPALPDVLPAPVRAPLQHQFIRPVPPSHHLPQYLARSNGWNSSVGRPSSAMPSSAMASSTMQLQPPSASYPTTNLTQHSDDVNASTHRGQMLSILSGALPLRPPAGGTFRSGSALYDSGMSRSPSSNGSFSSTSTVGSVPRSANTHLLSILNSSSAASRLSPARMSMQTRQ